MYKRRRRFSLNFSSTLSFDDEKSYSGNPTHVLYTFDTIDFKRNLDLDKIFYLGWDFSFIYGKFSL